MDSLSARRQVSVLAPLLSRAVTSSNSSSGFFFVLIHFFFSFLSRIGYQGPDFDWADYLKRCEAEAAPQHCFPAVSPNDPFASAGPNQRRRFALAAPAE